MSEMWKTFVDWSIEEQIKLDNPRVRLENFKMWFQKKYNRELSKQEVSKFVELWEDFVKFLGGNSFRNK